MQVSIRENTALNKHMSSGGIYADFLDTDIAFWKSNKIFNFSMENDNQKLSQQTVELH